MSGPETADASAAIRAALSEVDPDPAELIVILSPHGRETGVYSSIRGHLGGFGYPGVATAMDHDAAAAQGLADTWDQPLLDDAVDYGVLVPLLLWEPAARPAREIGTVAATLREGAPEGEAARFAEALRATATDRDVLFVASANGSAALTPRAPLTEIEGARSLEDRLLDALRTDAAEVEDAARALASDAGSCGAGPLIAFARLFAGRACRVVAHEAPVGVGYTVAVTDD